MNTRIGKILLVLFLLAGLTSAAAADGGQQPEKRLSPECPIVRQRVVEIEQLEETRPKAVAFLPDGRRVVGFWASRRGVTIEQSDGGWHYVENPMDFWVIDVETDPNTGYVWVAHREGWRGWNRGVSVLDPETGQYLAHYTENDVPALRGATKIAFTLDGSVWITSVSRGGMARRHPNGKWQNYEMPTGESWAVAVAPDGTLYAGRYRGINRYDPITDCWEHIRLEEDCPEGHICEEIYGLDVASDGTVWASGHHLYQISPLGEVHRYDLADIYFGRVLAIDAADRPWIGGYGGVSIFDPCQGEWTYHHSLERVEALVAYGGRVYAGEFYSGEITIWEVEVINLTYLPLVHKGM